MKEFELDILFFKISNKKTDYNKREKAMKTNVNPDKEDKKKRYGFFFGAGAETGYGLPSGGRFALEVFRRDTAKSKEAFRDSLNSIGKKSSYAEDWLPDNYLKKNISSFGKTAFQAIIKDTIEQNRDAIIAQFSEFDKLANTVMKSFKKKNGKDIESIIKKKIGKEIKGIKLEESIAYIDEFQEGNSLFKSSFFSSLLLLYQDGLFTNDNNRKEIGKILLSLLQLQIGALGERLAKNINEGIFKKKDVKLDLFDEWGGVFKLDYASAGLLGLEYLLDGSDKDLNDDEDCIVVFARELLEEMYIPVLSYKSLIDSYWRYLYSPKSDWAKFSKICVFLLTVREYIAESAENVQIENPEGYYRMLKEVVDKGCFEISKVATSNYNTFISDVFDDVAFLNGSTDMWYDPYLNKVWTGKREGINKAHFLVPFLFTQSGIKPLTSIEMSTRYVETYKTWSDSDAIVVVGFGFGDDDAHINAIIRTLVDDDDKKLVIVSLDKKESDEGMIQDISKKLRLSRSSNIVVIKVDKNGIVTGSNKADVIKKGKNWADFLSEKTDII